MRKRAGALLTGLALVAAVSGVAGSPATAQTPSEQTFSAFGTGTVLGLNALGIGGTIVANVQSARSAGAVHSQGLNAPGVDELGQNINPARLGKNAYGRGAGVEVGLLTGAIQGVDVNQLILEQLAEADAPPPSSDVGEIALDLTPILRTSTAHGDAQAIYDINTCVVGRPITHGRGFVENLQVVTSGTDPNAALIASNNVTDNTNESRTATYLIPNGDGTFGLVAETRLHVAPISVGVVSGALPVTVSIEVLGPLVMRTIATGKPGGARIEYPGTPTLRVRLNNLDIVNLSLQSLLGQGGLNLPLGPVGTVTAGTPPHPIGGATTAPAVVDPNGTFAAGAVDAIRISLLQGLGLNVADLRVGHMEGGVQVPAGGIRCNVPIAKIGTPDPVRVGQDFTITIRIPSDAALFEQLYGCDLIGIRVVDVHESDGPTFTLTGASNGGVISADGTTVTWENIGNYTIGDPPIELTITGNIPGNSRAGTLRDTATVTATLGNCRGDVEDGTDITGSVVGGGQVTGTFTLIGPEVSRAGALAATGGDQRVLLLGGVLLLGALGVHRKLRKPARATK